MNNALPVGVSIVVYRTPEDELVALIESLLRENVARVYVVDNAEGPSALAKVVGRFPRTEYLAGHGNVGYGRGHNLAIADSVRKHAYHLVCNPDIDVPARAISCLREVMDERPDVGLCMPRIVGRDGKIHHLCKRLPTPYDLVARRFMPAAWTKERMRIYEMRDQSYENEMNPPTLSGCFMFFRSTVLSSLGGFDQRFFMYMEDTDLSRRAGEVARNLYYPTVTVVHGYAAGSYKRLRLLGCHAISALKYFNKWGWFPLA